MKQTYLLLCAVLLMSVTTWFTSCGSKSNPTAPPANTPTITNSPTITLSPTWTLSPTATSTKTVTSSPTQTFTPTNSATATNSSTATLSPTETESPTSTGTATSTETGTESFTPTSTGTPTNSFTPTSTGTITDSPTQTLSPTSSDTATATLTPTPTGTPTGTPTFSSTPTVTLSPTITATAGFSISGSLNYSGSDTSISAARPAVIMWSASSNMNPPSLGATINTNGGSYSFPVSAAGTYYLMAFVNGTNVPPCTSADSGTQGEVFQLYGGSCTASSPLTVTGNTTGVNFSFNDSCGQVTGVSGTVTYTGSRTISPSNPLCIEAFSDSTYSTRVSTEYNVTCNNTPYSLFTGGTTVLYLEAFVVLDGNYAHPDAGDPYVQLGAFTPSTTLNIPINFGDNNVYGTPSSTPTVTVTPTITTTPAYSISGTVNYTGSITSVTTGHPVVILCGTSTSFSTYFRAGEVSANNGSFSFPVTAAGTYYLSLSVGTVDIPPCQKNQITQGAVLGIYGSCSTGLIPINVTSNTSGIGVTFDDSCGQYYGESGGVTYTGSLGTVSSSKPIVLRGYSDSGYTAMTGEDEITCNDTTYSEPATAGTSAKYYQAFVDLNGDETLDPGDPYINMGQFTPSTTLTIPINFGDNNIYTTPYTLSGTVNYQGAGTNPLYMVLQSGGYAVSVIGPITNGGSYTISNLTEASQLYAGYDNTGNGLEISGSNVLQGNGGSLTGSGDIVVLVGYTGSCPNTSGQTGTTYNSTSTVNIVFGGSTGQSGTSCTK